MACDWSAGSGGSGGGGGSHALCCGGISLMTDSRFECALATLRRARNLNKSREPLMVLFSASLENAKSNP